MFATVLRRLLLFNLKLVAVGRACSSIDLSYERPAGDLIFGHPTTTVSSDVENHPRLNSIKELQLTVFSSLSFRRHPETPAHFPSACQHTGRSLADRCGKLFCFETSRPPHQRVLPCISYLVSTKMSEVCVMDV